MVGKAGAAVLTLAAGAGAVALALYGNSAGWWQISNPFGKPAAAAAAQQRARAQAERAQSEAEFRGMHEGNPSRWSAANYSGGIAQPNRPEGYGTGYSASRFMAAANPQVPSGRSAVAGGADTQSQYEGSRQQDRPGYAPTAPLLGRAGSTSTPRGLASAVSQARCQ
jgi:hypothetical protein